MEPYVIAALLLIAIVQGLVIVRLSRALSSVGRFGDRVAHLSAAMELLTDTTEAGLGNVATEIERLATERAPRVSRRVAARRISTAVRRGQSVEEIAATEALSHGEVRLHMHLATPEEAKGATDGTLRG